MFFIRCSYKNSYSSRLVYNSSARSANLMICSFKIDVPKRYCFGFYAFAFKGFLFVYIAYPWRFAKIYLVFVSKILFFEIVS